MLKEMEIPDYLTCLLRNLYAGQEARAKTLNGTTDWFRTEKGVRQGCLWSPCLFNFMRIIMRNARLDELQAGIKVAGRNINSLRYVDDTTVMTESEEELNEPPDEGEGESKKAGLKLNIKKTKIMASGLITSWQIEGEKMEAMTDFLLGL